MNNRNFTTINSSPDSESPSYTPFLMQKSYMTTRNSAFHTLHRFELGEYFIAWVKLLNIPIATFQTNNVSCFLLFVSTWHQIMSSTLKSSKGINIFRCRQHSICKPAVSYLRCLFPWIRLLLHGDFRQTMETRHLTVHCLYRCRKSVMLPTAEKLLLLYRNNKTSGNHRNFSGHLRLQGMLVQTVLKPSKAFPIFHPFIW